MGAELLRDELPRYLAGELTPQAQDDHLATMAPLLDKADGRIDWDKPSDAVHNQIRGMNPWPGAHSRLGRVVHILHHQEVQSIQNLATRILIDPRVRRVGADDP